jgi:hypothetical protein
LRETFWIKSSTPRLVGPAAYANPDLSFHWRALALLRVALVALFEI